MDVSIWNNEFFCLLGSQIQFPLDKPQLNVENKL